MTSSLVLRDVGALAIQLAALILAAATLWQLLRIRHSRVSLAFWRVLLLVCVLLPIIQPWHAPAPLAGATTVRSIEDRPDVSARDRSPQVEVQATSIWPAGGTAIAVLIAGATLRLLWLLLGAASLARLRRTAVRIDDQPAFWVDAQAKAGARADLYVSPQVAGPITFGLRYPIVVLPPTVLEMDVVLQEAIAVHELLHVKRRDWLHLLGEEAVRTVFWFHPAIWWLIGRIHLCRELVVDDAVIRLTHSRDRYVEAMLAVALAASPVVLTPAPLFLRRRFLKRRVAHLLQETTMTTRRLIASLVAGVAALSLVGTVAVRAFPLHTQARQAPRQHSQEPVELIRGGDHLLHGSLPEYPPRAIEQRIDGEVTLDLTVDDRGEVSDARVLSGPEELRRATLEAVLGWHFSPDAVRSTLAQVVVRFTVPPAGTTISEEEYKQVTTGFKIGNQRKVYTVSVKREPLEVEVPPEPLERQLVELKMALEGRELTDTQRADYARKYEAVKSELEQVRAGAAELKAKTSVEGLPLSAIRVERVRPEIVKAIQDRAGVAVGQAMNEAAMKSIVEAARTIDEHIRVRFARDGGGLVLILIAP